MSSLLSSPGLSFYAVPALWINSIGTSPGCTKLTDPVPHFIAAAISKSDKRVQGFENVSPRAWNVKVAASEKITPAHQQILRADAASANGFENLAFFAVSMLAAHYARVPVSFINKATIFYVASRVLYNVLYIRTTTESLSNLRSVTFVAGVLANFALLIKAGNSIAGGLTGKML